MKMKERDVTKNYRNLAGIGNLVLPSKLSFAISCNIEKLKKEAERIEKERKKLCEQYAEKDAEGKPVMVDSVIEGHKTQEYKMSDDDKKMFLEEYESLLDEEVEISIRTIKQEVLEKCETADRYNIPTVSQLIAMSFMIEE